MHIGISINELIFWKSLILTFIVFISLELSSQWVQVTSGSVQNLYDVHFPNDSTGYAVGYSGTVLFCMARDLY